MAVGDQQRITIGLLEKILQEKACMAVSFPWLVNKHLEEDFGEYYEAIDSIFTELGGDRTGLDNKRKRELKPDCYFGGKYNFIFEYDELQHFTKYKKNALQNYPSDLEYNFDIKRYMHYCNKYNAEAIKKGPSGYRKQKMEFPFENGRATQRAYLDAFRDLLPTLHGLNPTLRISEFDIGFELGFNQQSREKLVEILDEQKIIKQFGGKGYAG